MVYLQNGNSYGKNKKGHIQILKLEKIQITSCLNTFSLIVHIKYHPLSDNTLPYPTGGGARAVFAKFCSLVDASWSLHNNGLWYSSVHLPVNRSNCTIWQLLEIKHSGYLHNKSKKMMETILYPFTVWMILWTERTYNYNSMKGNLSIPKKLAT